MNVIKIKSLISAALALIMTVGIFAAIPAPAAAEEKIYNHHSDLEPLTMKFKEDPDGNYDYVSVAAAYATYSYYLDMEYLLRDFDVDKFLEQNEKGYIYMYILSGMSYNVRYTSKDVGYFSDRYPIKVVYGKDRYDSEMYYYDCHYQMCAFGRGAEKQSYDNICMPKNAAIFLDGSWKTGYRPVKLTLMVTSDKDHEQVAYKKSIGINLYGRVDNIKNVDIYDFEFPGKHGAVMDTDAWSNVGNVVSIRYLDENKKTERTKLVAGDKGYVEFTVVMPQGFYIDLYRSGLYQSTDLTWDSSVKTSLKGSACSNIGTSSASHVTTSENQYVCKFYHSYEIADNADYVITQGTIGLTAPKAGAKANKDVETSNVKKIVRRGPTGAVTSSPQFTVDKAAWLNIDKRGTMKYVDSFAAGNIYHALVKLTPDGNYYFNADSVAALQVPGADSFNIGYMKAGDVNGFVKEDGWYLLANFSVKNGSTPDTTPITTPVTTPPVTEPRTPMSLLPVGAQNIVVNDTATDFSFEVMAQNATGNVRYMWQACDSNGNVSDPTELSNGQAFLHHGMSMADNGKTQYYKCTAISGSDIASLVFSVRLEIKYFSLTIGYNKTDLTVEQGDSADVTAQTNIDPTLVSDLVVEWYRADNADGKNEKKLTSAKTTTLTVPTDTTGTAYYRCNVSCIWDGEYSRTVYTSSKYVKVTVNAKAAVTTPPPAVTTAPPAVTTAPPAVTTAPPAVTTAPPAITTAPPEVTTAPTEVTTAPPAVTTAPTEVTTAPAEITTAPADVTTSPEESKTVGGDVTTAPTPGDSDSSSATVWIIVGVAVAVLAAAAVAVVLIMKKKRK